MSTPLLLWLLLLVSRDAPADTAFVFPSIEREGVQANLAVRVDPLDPDQNVPIIQLTVTASGPPGLELESRLDDPTGDWQTTVTSAWSQAESKSWWETVYRLRQVKPGPAPLPAVKARFRANRLSAWWEASWIDILKEPREPPEPTLPVSSDPAARPIGLAAAVCLVGALLMLMLWVRRRRKRRPGPTMDELAAAALERLAAHEGAPSPVQLAELGDVVRQGLAARHGIPASRQTTDEFLNATSKILAPDQHTVLEGLLRRCDLAKFARASVPPEEYQRLIEQARLLLQPLIMKSDAQPVENANS